MANTGQDVPRRGGRPLHFDIRLSGIMLFSFPKAFQEMRLVLSFDKPASRLQGTENENVAPGPSFFSAHSCPL